MKTKIYNSNQLAELYRSLGRTPPPGVIDLSATAIDLENSSNKEARPHISHFFERIFRLIFLLIFY